MSSTFGTFSSEKICYWAPNSILPHYFCFRRHKMLLCWWESVKKYAYKSIIQIRWRISPAFVAILRAEAKRRHYRPLNCFLEWAWAADDKRSKINVLDCYKGPLIVIWSHNNYFIYKQSNLVLLVGFKPKIWWQILPVFPILRGIFSGGMSSAL